MFLPVFDDASEWKIYVDDELVAIFYSEALAIDCCDYLSTIGISAEIRVDGDY